MAVAPRNPQDGAWTYDIFNDLFADPAVCIISYCLPCVQYGVNAERVHGPAGSCPSHGLKYWLYSCICLCGLVAGPTRKSVRDAYKLPAAPAGLGDEANTDCIVHTIPCTACFALCQEANEIKARNVAAPIAPMDFDWAPAKPAPAGATTITVTTPPAPQPQMSKEAAPVPAPTPVTAPVVEAVPVSTPAPAATQ